MEATKTLPTRRWSNVGAILLFLCGVSCAVLSTAAAQQLGTNLTEVNDYSPQMPFRNIFLNSREWFTQCRAGMDPGCSSANSFDTGEAESIDLDQNGWVRSLPARSDPQTFTSVATFWDVPSNFPAGRYVVLYRGHGTIEYDLAARKLDADSGSGRDVIQVDPSRGGILLRIAATAPSDYIRDIRVVAESDESTLDGSPFTQAFLDRLRPYRVLRYMDWMRTNNSVVTSWSGRAKQTDARFSTARGVPLEIMLTLSNTAGKSPWFNIPHRADDTYIQSFAEQVRRELSAELVAYVEYSNEVWNSAFSQGAYVEERGQSEWSGSGESAFTKRMNWHGKRSAEVCDIFKRVFSDSPARVVCVIAAQAANSWTAEEALRCPLWDSGPCVGHAVNALAIAPYFGDYLGQESAEREVSGWTRTTGGGVSRIFAELESGGELSHGPRGGALQQSSEWISENLRVAQSFGLTLITYEGGQHLVGVGSASDNSRLTELFTSANRDDRMERVYSRYLRSWNELGGGLFMHFTDISDYSKYGSWGALEKIGETTSPKYNALMTYAGIAPLPGPTDGADNNQPQLTVRISGRGTVATDVGGIRCTTTCTALYTKLTTVVARARASRGARFRRWTGACHHSNPRCVIKMSRSRRVQAVFER